MSENKVVHGLAIAFLNIQTAQLEHTVIQIAVTIVNPVHALLPIEEINLPELAVSDIMAELNVIAFQGNNIFIRIIILIGTSMVKMSNGLQKILSTF